MKSIAIIISLVFVSLNLKSQWTPYNVKTNSVNCDIFNYQTKDTILISESNNVNQDIIYSTDGGKTYIEMFPLPSLAWGKVYHVRFISADTLLYITGKGILKRSLNASDFPFFIVTFKDYDSIYTDQTPMSFFHSNDSGIVVCSHVFKTFDNGKNWSLVGPSEYYSNGGYKLFFLPNSRKYIANRGFKIIESEDYGKTWKDVLKIKEIANSGEWPIIHYFQPVNDSIFFLALHDGGFTNAKTLLFKSINGGKTWENIIQYPYRLWIHFLDSSNGYALVENGLNIIKSTNGGKTWDIEHSFSIENTGSDRLFYFNDSCFFATNQGKLYKRKKLSLSIISKNKEKVNISIYPNPFSNSINVLLDENLSLPIIISLYDLSGKKIINHHLLEVNNNIDLPNLSKGTYILKLEANEEVIATYKILKE